MSVQSERGLDDFLVVASMHAFWLLFSSLCALSDSELLCNSAVFSKLTLASTSSGDKTKVKNTCLALKQHYSVTINYVHMQFTMCVLYKEHLSLSDTCNFSLSTADSQ